jgi:Ca-activated chloride channel family protein
MLRRRPLRVVTAAAMLAGALPALAQSAPSAPNPKGPLTDEQIEMLQRLHHTEEEKVRLVLVPTAVEDQKGRAVKDLTQRNFRVLEDQVPQAIAYFDREADEPISVAFLLDLSGSMRQLGKLEAAKEAIRTFVESLRPKDRFGLVGFADEQVAWITHFTTDRKRFLERLDVQEGYGQTALNDAVAAAPSLVDQDVTGRKAIVLLTDGVDTRSRMSVNEAIAKARHADVPIYTIGFTALPDMVIKRTRKDTPDLNLAVLERFSNETGGKLHLINDPDDWKEAVADVTEDLRFQYVLGYYPKRERWDGSFRRIQVETGRGRLVVRARNGYYAMP